MQACKLTTSNLAGSRKAVGLYEAPIIGELATHFRSFGYDAFPHVSLNISRAPVVSDVDLILVRNDSVTAIEVKSRHDKLRRAIEQIHAISSFIDFAYVATDKNVNDWDLLEVGLLYVHDGKVEERVRAKELTQKPGMKDLFALRKICLRRIMGDSSVFDYYSKFELAEAAYARWNTEDLSNCLHQVAVCIRNCDKDCPIWKSTSSQSNLSPRRSSA